MQSGSIRSRPRPASVSAHSITLPLQGGTDRGLSGAPLHQILRPQTSERAHRVPTRSIRLRGGLPAAVSAAGRWSTRSPSLAQTIRRRRSFKQSRRLWFREQLVELGIASPDGLATQLQLLVDGSIAGNLVRDDLTMACAAKQAAKVAAEECGGCSRLTSATSPVPAEVASRANPTACGNTTNDRPPSALAQ